MNQLLDRILERPQGQKLAILAVMIILLAGLDYNFLYAPRAAEIGKLNEDIESAHNDKNLKQQKAANLARLQKEIRELDARLKEAVAQLPNKREIPDLLSSISNKARESGLEIVLFRPRAENYQDFYAEVPVDIIVKGRFHNVVSFFDEVGHLDRLVNINNIGFKNSKVTDDQVTVETSSLATAFRFLDEAERKKVAEQKAKAAKEKK
jgi:type IV pilus assembly protein PilO